MNKRNFLILIFLFFSKIFIVKTTEAPISIVDDDVANDVAKYFDSNWVDNIKKQRNTILVKMNKVDDGADSNDYESTFQCQKDLNYKGQHYRIFINVKKDHKLTYTILKKVEIGGEILYNEITDENDEKIFYDFKERDKKTNKKIYNKDPSNTLHSYNWVLAKIKPNDEDNYYYVFINDIGHVVNGGIGYCCLGHWNKIKDFNFIYSKISYVNAISATLDSYDTELVNIDFT